MLQPMIWRGVMPAITTPFQPDGEVDHVFLAQHAEWLVEHGVTGIVPLGSLGEGATLSFKEKCDIMQTLVTAVGDRCPVVPGIAALSTDEAVKLATEAARVGCRGLMVLPPYVYQGTWGETKSHFAAVLSATPLSCMLYNNPIAYGTDVLPHQMLELATEFENLSAVKDSGGDVRRITELKAVLGERLALFAGLDDMVVEAVHCGAEGWIAGLVNALPKESMDLFNHAIEGRHEEAKKLYYWFLPLLKLDTVPHFVQLIKLVQQECGQGSERVRAPRQVIEGEDRTRFLALIRESLNNRN